MRGLPAASCLSAGSECASALTGCGAGSTLLESGQDAHRKCREKARTIAECRGRRPLHKLKVGGTIPISLSSCARNSRGDGGSAAMITEGDEHHESDTGKNGVARGGAGGSCDCLHIGVRWFDHRRLGFPRG